MLYFVYVVPNTDHLLLSEELLAAGLNSEAMLGNVVLLLAFFSCRQISGNTVLAAQLYLKWSVEVFCLVLEFFIMGLDHGFILLRGIASKS